MIDMALTSNKGLAILTIEEIEKNQKTNNTDPLSEVYIDVISSAHALVPYICTDNMIMGHIHNGVP